MTNCAVKYTERQVYRSYSLKYLLVFVFGFLFCVVFIWGVTEDPQRYMSV